MAKNVAKTYQKFKGINQKDSSLLTNMSEFSNAENYIFNGGTTALEAAPDNVSLIGRVGHQVYTQKCSALDTARYVYATEENGIAGQLTVREEHLAFGHSPFRIYESYFFATRSAASVDVYYSVLLDPNTSTFKFNLYEDGVSVFTQDLGTGLEDVPYTIYDLALAIDALPNWGTNPTVTFPKIAKVNGTQTLVTTITVDAGHTILAGDRVTIYSRYASGLGVSPEGLVTAIVTAVTATTITIQPLSTATAVSVDDNIYFNELAVPAACIGIGSSEVQDATAGASLTLFYAYLDPIYSALGKSIISNIEGVSFYNKVSSINARDVFYFSYPSGYQGLGYLLKYDGQNVYRAGLPKPVFTATASNASGLLSTGSYSYIALFKFIDHRGNIILGAESDPVEVELAGGNDTVTLNFSALSFLSSEPRINLKGGTSGAVAATNLATITSANIQTSFDPGDTMVLQDRASASYPGAGSIVRKKINGVNKATGQVTFTGNVTLNSGDLVSCNLTVEIYRTNVNGTEYYLNTEIVPSVNLATYSYVDNFADTALGARLTREIAGKERDMPPPMDIISEHQGLLLGTQGNTTYYSLPGEYENFPASHSIEFPFEGRITGIVSETDDRVLITKQRAIYKIEGDLDAGNFITPSLSEGDFGVANNASIVKLKNLIIGLGQMGFIGVRNGQLLLNDEGDSLIGAYINPEVRKKIVGVNTAFTVTDTPLSNIDASIAANNPMEGSYQCWIPDGLQFARDGVDSQAKGTLYIFDYMNGGAWTKQVYSGLKNAPTSRQLNINQDVFFNGLYRTSADGFPTGHIFRKLYAPRYKTLPVSNKYADNHLPITYRLKTRDEHLDMPSTYKEFIWFKVFSFLPFTNFTLDVTTYLNFVGASFGNPTFELSFTSDANDISRFHRFQKLNLNKAFAISFELVSDAIHECPFISGLELVYNNSYLEEEPSY